MKMFILLCMITMALFATGLTKSGDFVIDNKNKLMWQDNKENLSIKTTQVQAVQYCKNLSLKGFSNWTLPSRKNYETIIDKSRIKAELMIDKVFQYANNDAYWTRDRTWIRNFGNYGYYVLFRSGSIYYQNRTYEKYVRCVRDIK